mmetsp:Transcript_37227/g.78520  ORF Transcript_37227/g.78520 Transcript_37227/m.78520 type:complete len:306 (+) Transcript_37227:982-1899(+)
MNEMDETRCNRETIQISRLFTGIQLLTTPTMIMRLRSQIHPGEEQQQQGNQSRHQPHRREQFHIPLFLQPALHRNGTQRFHLGIIQWNSPLTHHFGRDIHRRHFRRQFPLQRSGSFVRDHNLRFGNVLEALRLLLLEDFASHAGHAHVLFGLCGCFLFLFLFRRGGRGGCGSYYDGNIFFVLLFLGRCFCCVDFGRLGFFHTFFSSSAIRSRSLTISLCAVNVCVCSIVLIFFRLILFLFFHLISLNIALIFLCLLLWLILRLVPASPHGSHATRASRGSFHGSFRRSSSIDLSRSRSRSRLDAF